MADTIDTGRTVKVLGKEYPVVLKDAPGFHRVMFCADLGEQTLEAETFTDLATQARDYKDERFALKFTTRTGRKGTVTGFHAANGNLLIRWDDGKTQQARTHEFSKTMPALSDEDHAELIRLLSELTDAEKALDRFLDEHAFPHGLKGAAQQARREAAGIE